jgi:hypothetical protein
VKTAPAPCPVLPLDAADQAAITFEIDSEAEPVAASRLDAAVAELLLSLHDGPHEEGTSCPIG